MGEADQINKLFSNPQKIVRIRKNKQSTGPIKFSSKVSGDKVITKN